MDPKNKTSKYDIADLPELPLEAFELSGKLEQHGFDPVLSIKPLKLPRPKKPDVATAPAQKCSYMEKTYLSQVLYPKVVCYPPSELFDTAIATALQHPLKDVSPNEFNLDLISNYNRFYKLSKFKGTRLTNPFYCTVKYGPWSAVVVEKEACDTDGASSWTLTVNAIPGLLLHWYGTWLNVPSYPLLQIIKGDLSLNSQKPNCCPGCKWCPATHTCILNSVSCEGDVHI